VQVDSKTEEEGDRSGVAQGQKLSQCSRIARDCTPHGVGVWRPHLDNQGPMHRAQIPCHRHRLLLRLRFPQG
jgi:hypothetical protein